MPDLDWPLWAIAAALGQLDCAELLCQEDRERAMMSPNQPGVSDDRRAAAIDSISAVTLATHDMARALRFYVALGFPLRYGGESAPFSSLGAGSGYLNLIAQAADRAWSWWGRVIFYVSDVDALYHEAVAQGLQPDFSPRDATWGERYFHITDPDGHELSFAEPLR